MLYLDAAREFWREWVVNYDFIHQMDVSRKADEVGRGLFQKLNLRWHDFYGSLVERARHARAKISPAKASLATVGAIAALLLLFNLRKILRLMKKRKLARDPASAPKLAATIWYERMTVAIAKRGWEKRASQTPSEFVTMIEDPELRRSVERFTERYHSARFGDSVEDAVQLPKLYEEITSKTTE